MRPFYRIFAFFLSLAYLAGCGEPIEEDTPGACEAEPFAKGPERLLILNGKMSNKEANYTLNERAGDGHWIGSELLVYDPATPGEVRHLGRFDFGEDSEDFDKEQLLARDIAYHAEQGLWGIFTDTGFNDEWYLGHIDVPDFSGENQRLPVTLYAFRPTDTAIYGRDEITGMAFVGDEILLGTPAIGAFRGAVIEVEGPFPPSFEEPENPYYISDDRGRILVEPDGQMGVGGDIVALGGKVYASMLPGNDPAQHRLAILDREVRFVGQGSKLDKQDWITGLGKADGRLLGITLEGKVYEVDLKTGAFSCFDDLDDALPPDELGQSTRRLRGVASVVLP